MKKESYILVSQHVLSNVLGRVGGMPLDGSVEVVIRNASKSKTLAQLGGLFARWIKQISAYTGEEEDYIHRKLKAMFLARVYVAEPIGEQQEQWVELLAVYQEQQDREKLTRHAKRISLSWATIVQMREYMTRICEYYSENGLELEPFRRDK